MKFSDLTLTLPYLKLPPLLYELVKPTPLQGPYLISVSQNAAALLGVDEPLFDDERLLALLSGEEFLEGSEPFAMSYAGHQFGEFVPRLGDGRVINLGKIAGQNLQLKGAGLTSYSRLGDGRAVLRSSLREFLVSEAMAALGIKTSRALALVGSQTQVRRKGWESAAMVLRLSPTWVRFGTFEYLYSAGAHEALRALGDYVIEESFPALQTQSHENIYAAMYECIVKESAKTVAAWQSVGFVHGVMNSDNMAIDGTTIDYGPFAFLDSYEKYFVCNTTDVHGRYSFSSQAGAAQWNLEALSVALSPLCDEDTLEDILEEHFRPTYERHYHALMYAKMGLKSEQSDDRLLLASMLKALGESKIDYTLFFRHLSRFDGDTTMLLDHCVYREPMRLWLERYELRLRLESQTPQERHKKMLNCNPKYILKNHLLQQAIEMAEKGDFSMVCELLEVALSPYEEHEEFARFAAATPLEYKNQKLSCSS